MSDIIYETVFALVNGEDVGQVALDPVTGRPMVDVDAVCIGGVWYSMCERHGVSPYTDGVCHEEGSHECDQEVEVTNPVASTTPVSSTWQGHICDNHGEVPLRYFTLTCSVCNARVVHDMFDSDGILSP
jgi:hypothetical protein